MDLTVKKLRSVISRGGVWILLVNKPEMDAIFFQLKRERDMNITRIRCETVADATKASLLIEAFNTWTLEGIREFMKSRDNFPKVEL